MQCESLQLRDSQTDCTDTECESPTGTGGADAGFTLPMMLALWGVAALVLFITRPQSLRLGGNRQPAEKQPLNEHVYVAISH